jgi:class 3 adenylate cyclase
MEGINKTIFEWAKKSEILRNTGWFNRETKSLLERALGERADLRFVSSIDLCKKIWANYPELGTSPMLFLLGEEEYNRSFYDSYRDHVTHSIKVFFLGLFIYEKNVKIKEMFCDSDKDDFVRIWMVSALWHDVGYLFENNLSSEFDRYINNMISNINIQNKNILSNIIEDLSPAIENAFYRESNISPMSIKDIDEIESQKIFDKLKNIGIYTQLTSDRTVNAIHILYLHLQTADALDNVPSHKDHGIFSALLILLLWSKFDELINSVVEFITNQTGTPTVELLVEANRQILDLYEKMQAKRSQSIILKAAQAIALHNISKEIKSEKLEKVSLDSFNIKVLNNRNYKSLPFAYLLKLVDNLQEWDRTTFSVPTLNNLSLGGEEMDIQILNDYIGIWFQDDDLTFKNPEYSSSKFCKIKNNLSQYIEVGELLRGLKASQIQPRIADDNNYQIIDIFYNIYHRELMDSIRDTFRCKSVELLLYNTSLVRFELLFSDGTTMRISDELEKLAIEKYKVQNSVNNVLVDGENIALALISTNVGAIGFLLLHGVPNASNNKQEKHLNNYGMLYGNLVLKAVQEAVHSAMDDFDSTITLKNLSSSIGKYIPFGERECISVFLDIRKLAQLLNHQIINRNRKLVQLIQRFSNDVEIISKNHGGMIMTHFGGGMLIIFQALSTKDRDAACCRAVCAMIEIRNKFNSLVSNLYKESHAGGETIIIGMGMGACAGKAFFTSFGYSSCIYYTGIGDDIAFAKKIENIADRRNNGSETIESSSLQDGILVSQTVYDGCITGRLNTWIDFEIAEDNKVFHYFGNNSDPIYYVRSLDRSQCPLVAEQAAICQCYSCNYRDTC